jgi:WD40 repeat protein
MTLIQNLVNTIMDNFTLKHSVKFWKQITNITVLKYITAKILTSKGTDFKQKQILSTNDESKVNYLVILRDGNLISGGMTGIVHIWDKKSFKAIHSFRADDATILLIYELNDKRLLTRSNYFTLRVWYEYTLVQTINNTYACNGPVKELNGLLVMKVSNSRLNVFKVGRVYKDLVLVKSIKRSGVFSDFSQIKDGRLVTGSQNGDIRMFDTVGYKCVKVMKGHRSIITCILELNDGNLITASKELRLWDCNDKFKCIKVIEHSNDILYVKQVQNKIILMGLKFVVVYNYKYDFEIEVNVQLDIISPTQTTILNDERVAFLGCNHTIVIYDPRKSDNLLKLPNIYHFNMLSNNKIAAVDTGNMLVVYS